MTLECSGMASKNQFGCVTEDNVLDNANRILARIDAKTRISDLKDLNDHFFLSLYHAIVGEGVEGAILKPQSEDDRIYNCQLLIDNLANDILDFDLSHISAQDVISGNCLALNHLIEILEGLVELISEESPERPFQDKTHSGRYADESSDIDAISHTHGILSDVFEQEFGLPPSSTNNSLKKDKEKKGFAWGVDEEMSSDSLEHQDLRGKLHQIDRDKIRSNSSSDYGSTESLLREAESYAKLSLRSQKSEREGDQRMVLSKDEASRSSSSETIVENRNNREDGSAHPPSIRVSDLESKDTTFGDPHSRRAFMLQSTAVDVPKPLQTDASHTVSSKNYHTHTHIHYHQAGNEDPTSFAGSSEYTSRSPEKRGLNIKDINDSPVRASRAVQFPSESELPAFDIKSEETKKLTTLSELDRRLEELRSSVKNIYEKEDILDDAIGEEDSTTERIFGSKVKNTLPLPKNSDNFSDSEISYYPYGNSTKNRKELNEPVFRGILRKTRAQREEEAVSSSESEEDKRISPKKNPKNVRFKRPDVSKRDERLEVLIKRLANEQKESLEDVKTVKGFYRQKFNDLKKDYGKVTQNFMPETSEAPKRKGKRKKSPTRSKDILLSRVYKGTARQGRKPTKSQIRKRSASASPVRKYTPAGRLLLDESDILPVMIDEFPHLDISPRTCKLLYQKQMRQMALLKKSSNIGSRTKTHKQIEEAQMKQRALVEIMKKDLDHTQRIREQKLKKQQESQIQRKLRDKRMAAARARRYYTDYHVQMRGKMQKRKYKEEKVFKTLFQDALDIQLQRIHEMRQFAKEKRNLNAKRQQDELDSLENHYRDKFTMLAEDLAKEKQDMELREKHQKKVMYQLRNEMRKRMEQDIRDLQEQMVHDEDSYYFRQLDADRLKKEFQLATYRTRP